MPQTLSKKNGKINYLTIWHCAGSLPDINKIWEYSDIFEYCAKKVNITEGSDMLKSDLK